MPTDVLLDCSDADCCSLPAEFVRLRYYFGQRLGVVDLFDEQHYHAGKQRFHNIRSHGAGVMCGLTAERFALPATAEPTTVLRVKRGAALDPCGHELVVNADQCIDVAAWFQKHQSELQWTAGDHTLTVAICYRECPSNPMPSPRDPCGCDSGGCEFGRVREGFELKLLTDKEAAHCFNETFPVRAKLRAALADRDLAATIETLAGAACPDLPPDACLCLASFTVTVGQSPLRVTAIGEPNNAIPTRATLLSTAALQELLLGMAGQTSGASGAGPSLGAASFAGQELSIPIALADNVALVKQTFDPGFVQVRRFKPNGWDNPETVTVALDTGASPRIRIKWASAPQKGNYRLTITSPTEKPIVDEHMRSLRPDPFVFQFSLSGDPLVLGTPTF